MAQLVLPVSLKYSIIDGPGHTFRDPCSAFLVHCWACGGSGLGGQRTRPVSGTLHIAWCMRAPTSVCVTQREGHQTACDSSSYWLTGRANRLIRRRKRVQREGLEPFSAGGFSPGSCKLVWASPHDQQCNHHQQHDACRCRLATPTDVPTTDQHSTPYLGTVCAVVDDTLFPCSCISLPCLDAPWRRSTATVVLLQVAAGEAGTPRPGIPSPWASDPHHHQHQPQHQHQHQHRQMCLGSRRSRQRSPALHPHICTRCRGAAGRQPTTGIQTTTRAPRHLAAAAAGVPADMTGVSTCPLSSTSISRRTRPSRR